MSLKLKNRGEKGEGGGGKNGLNPKARALWRRHRAVVQWCLETTRNVKRKPMNHSQHAGNEG